MRTGAESHHHEHLLQELLLQAEVDHRTSRRSGVFALLYWEYLPRIVALNVHSRLLALLPSNSGESFSEVRINALRVTKGVIEDRFHRCPSAVFVSYERFCLR